ncbi:DUF4190 domain-containing protein [Saccharopolyspora sp. CA-218241]|uniref:DUF4190 domain-containing protein n=1 Tax=Saccharopolyspora sp. CA-218241 TaxID=3240027 RepID=UPI003D95D4E1
MSAYPDEPRPDGTPEPEQRRSNGAAVTAVVLGVIGLFCCFLIVTSVLAVVLGVIGSIFGVIALGGLRTRPDSSRGLAITGLCLSAVALIAGVAVSGSLAVVTHAHPLLPG